eukprot:2951409-Pleurochrysis_carterae.AAC.1
MHAAACAVHPPSHHLSGARGPSGPASPIASDRSASASAAVRRVLGAAMDCICPARQSVRAVSCAAHDTASLAGCARSVPLRVHPSLHSAVPRRSQPAPTSAPLPLLSSLLPAPAAVLLCRPSS